MSDKNERIIDVIFETIWPDSRYDKEGWCLYDIDQTFDTIENAVSIILRRDRENNKQT